MSAPQKTTVSLPPRALRRQLAFGGPPTCRASWPHRKLATLVAFAASDACAGLARGIDFFNCAGGVVDKTGGRRAAALPTSSFDDPSPAARRTTQGGSQGFARSSCLAQGNSRMKRFLLVALAAAALGTSSGC